MSNVINRDPNETKNDALITASYWLEHDHQQNKISTNTYNMRMNIIRKALGYDPLAKVN